MAESIDMRKAGQPAQRNNVQGLHADVKIVKLRHSGRRGGSGGGRSNGGDSGGWTAAVSPSTLPASPTYGSYSNTGSSSGVGGGGGGGIRRWKDTGSSGGGEDGSGVSFSTPKGGPRPPASQTSAAALAIQALPAILVFPVLQWGRFLLWVFVLSLLRSANGTLSWKFALFLSLYLTRLMLSVGLPIVGISFKWLVIGRYRAGDYPLWGQYYLRWWIVRQVLNLTGLGVFGHGDWSVVLYYRLLGARIGSGTRIDRRANISEPDLVTIGANTLVDGDATVSPFCMDSGSMLLRQVRLGEGCSPAARAFVASGHILPPGTCLGPLSSSYELSDARPEYRGLCRKSFSEPSAALRFLVGSPILWVGALFAALPWLLYLSLLAQQPWFVAGAKVHTVYDLLVWFGSANRLVWYVCIRQPIRAVVAPFFRLGYCIAVKRLVVGKFVAGPRPTGDWGLFRHWIMAELQPSRSIGGVAGLLGSHYEFVSVIYRMLGAKVGKRVYWPGSGMLGLYEHDLFDVGDDVVFGSRRRAGCMVADRCVLLPGLTIGRNALLGSGGLGAKHQRKGDTGYYVMTLWQHAAFGTAVAAVLAIVWKLPLFTALMAAARLDSRAEGGRFGPFIGNYLAIFLAVHGALAVAALWLLVAIKWGIMGQRQPGHYNWDESSYCQRWQLYLTLQSLARCGRETHLLELVCGSHYMVSYYRRLGASIGSDVCLYPNYAEPPMTEPDVVTIGDNSTIDNCSLVGHVNSMGAFSLNPVTIGARCTLRAFVRVLSGAGTEEHLRLLEHTLVVSGDIVDAGATWQGWPARVAEVDRVENPLCGGGGGGGGGTGAGCGSAVSKHTRKLSV